LKNKVNVSLKVITQDLHRERRFPPDPECENEDKRMILVRTCASIFFQVSFEKRYVEDQGEIDLAWEPELTLGEAVSLMFPLSVVSIPTSGSIPHKERWHRANTIERLTSWGYFKVAWTDQLHDHLLVSPHSITDDEVPTIMIFHHASFLTHSKAITGLYPKGLLHETRCTLGLLIPDNNSRVRTWFSGECEKGESLKILRGVFSLIYRSKGRQRDDSRSYG
jgi:hypothetical protein